MMGAPRVFQKESVENVSLDVNDKSPNILKGLRVLDLTRLLPGGFCTLLFADLGAEILKIEDPEQGDYLRWIPPFAGKYGAYYQAVNGGKKSLALNLKTEAGRRILLRLVNSADVFVENFRPGITVALGIDYERLQTVNPRLVYCSISGYGQSGPYQARAGHDINYAGLTGFLSGSDGGSETSEQSPCPPQRQVADIGTGYAAAVAILAALCARERTGEGAYLDIAIAEVLLTFNLLPLILAAEKKEEQSNSAGAGAELTGALACYNLYKTADGKFVSLGALEPKFWKAFLAAVDRPELFDQQWDSARQNELKATLKELFLQRPQEEWIVLFKNKPDACCEPVLSSVDLLRHPLFQARGVFSAANSRLKSVLQVASPVGQRPPQRSPAPEYGQDAAEILASCGFSPEEIREFENTGVIRLRPTSNMSSLMGLRSSS